MHYRKEGIVVEWQWLSSGILAVYTPAHIGVAQSSFSHAIANYERVVRSLLLEGLGTITFIAKTMLMSNLCPGSPMQSRAGCTLAVRLGCPERVFNLVSCHYDLDDIADYFGLRGSSQRFSGTGYC